MEPDEIFGEWWTAADPTRRVPGRFTYDPSSGGLLRITGRLDVEQIEPGRFGEGTTIHGQVHASKPAVTLLRAEHVGERTQHGSIEPPFVEQQFQPAGVLAGYQFPDSDPPTFTNVSFTLDGLIDWARPGALIDSTETNEADGARVEHIAVRYPASQVFTLQQGKLKLYWGGRWRHELQRIERNPEAIWHFEGHHPMSVDDLHLHVIRPLRHFHVVVTGQPTHESQVRVGIKADDDDPPVNWDLSPRRHGEPTTSRTDRSSWPLTLDAFDDPADALARWFDLYERCRTPLFGILTVLSRELDFVVETEFFTLAQSAEAYHRCHPSFANHNPTYAQHRDRVKTAMSGESSDVRHWVLGRLRDEPSFRDRIMELVEYAGQFGQLTTSQRRTLTSRVRSANIAMRGHMDCHSPPLMTSETLNSFGPHVS